MALNHEGRKQERLKVLVCAYACLLESGSPVSGGEATLGWSMVKQLARFHDVWVLTATSNRVGIEAEKEQRPVPYITFCYVDLPAFARPLLRFPGGVQLYAYFWQVRAYFAARKLHQQVKFDVFHHVTFANDWMASYVGALLPVPYLRGPGGGSHRTPPAFLREYTFSARMWERFRVFGQWVLRHDPIFMIGQRRAKALLLCNREAAEAVPKRFKNKVQLFPVNGFSDEDLRIISAGTTSGAAQGSQAGVEPPGVRTEQAQAGSAEAASVRRGLEVLSAGKLLGLKAFPLAIRAFARFAEHHADARFTIVGEGPERPRLEQLIRELGMEKQVRLTRWAPRHELLAMMRQCDVFLFPSLRDGGGAVVVEAMAAGRPVICMDLAGPGLHITPECGIKVTARSPREAIELMAQALETLHKDEELRLKMGHGGRLRAEQNYSWAHLGERLLKIYQEALGTRSCEA
jgi:glycosyltransferase involved in cell wall biosynthesis